MNITVGERVTGDLSVHKMIHELILVSNNVSEYWFNTEFPPNADSSRDYGTENNMFH